MAHILFRCLVVIVILFGLLIIPSGQVDALRVAPVTLANPVVTLLSPAACPSSGCAAGQHLNYKVDFSFTRTDPTRNPNIQVCIYVPINWSVPQVTVAGLGSTTNAPYTQSTSNCVALADLTYTLVVGAVAPILASSGSESLGFAFRLGPGASANGSVIVRIYERDTTNTWTRTGEGSNTVNVVATATSVFVANDATTCGTSSPCYINSGDDQDKGYGTGLKDAIDGATSPATLSVLGNYSIKSNTVLVDKPVVIKSPGSARITYAVANPSCTPQYMLKVTAGASLSGLTIDDGYCTSVPAGAGTPTSTPTSTTNASPHRNLVLVDSLSPVLIESSDLGNGQGHGLDAIHVASTNAAALTVRYNSITNNSGWAIYLESNSNSASTLNVYANNIFGNKSGSQVECNNVGAARGLLDHNYWGAGILASAGVSDCSVTDTKRLGAPILDGADGRGVQAQQVTVTTNLVFTNSIGYQRTGAGTDFGLVIVNHGTDNIPFIPGQLGSPPTVCSNFWDVFLANATAPASPAALNLFLKYDLNAGCITNVGSSQYCGQTSEPNKYPLYWFSQSENNWKTTGAGGQPTVCRTDTNKDIQVTIDNTAGNHPNFSDLARLPFVVALPGQLVVTSLIVTPGSNQATVKWVTTDETNIIGFYIQRSTQDVDTSFQDATSLITRLGVNNGGTSYQYTDLNLTNGTTYYYRLRVERTDHTSVFTNIVIATPSPPPPTATLVPSRTLFPTSTFIYLSPTPTFTFTPSPTSPFKTITNTPLASATSATRPTSTRSPSPLPTTALPATALAQTRAARTEFARQSETPTPTFTPTPVPVSKQAEPLTIVMAFLAAGTLAGGAFYLLRERHLYR